VSYSLDIQVFIATAVTAGNNDDQEEEDVDADGCASSHWPLQSQRRQTSDLGIALEG
jgi:hypothetical protein